MAALAAEARKLVTLPAVWVAAALAIGLPVALAAANAAVLRHALETGDTEGFVSTSTLDEGFGQLTFGIVGVVVLAVVAVSSEYARSGKRAGASRQVLTTMVAQPRRGGVVAAKLVVLVTGTVALAAVAIPLTLYVSQQGLGRYATDFSAVLVQRAGGATAYWVCTALLASGVTFLTRSGVVPMALLITNASMVSVSLLVAPLTPLAKYLPDLAAYPSFLTDLPVADHLAPAVGLAVCAVWSAASIVAAAASYFLRDA